MLTAVAPKQAYALKIDIASIAAKVSDWVGKITDTTTKVTQQVSQVKQMATQGFSKEGLLNFAKGYLGNYVGDFAQRLKSSSQKEMIKDTEDKERKKLETELNAHVETTEIFYDVQIEFMGENIKALNDELRGVESELNSAKSARNSKKSAYNQIQNSGNMQEIDKAFNEYYVQESKVEELEIRRADLKEKIEEFNTQKNNLSNEKNKIGTNEDAEYVRIKAQQDAIVKAGERIDLSVDMSDDDEWDNDSVIEKYTTEPEKYQEFVDRYFYDASKITSTETEQKIRDSQAEMDRVMRLRRQLIVENAAHLLQLTASIRRNIPKRTEKVKEMFDGVRSTDSELQAIGYYSGTKIENMRALLMYAKIQTAKLQYLAAKDLSKITPYRRKVDKGSNDESFSGFNLEKYILTGDYVNSIIEENSETVDLHAGMEE
jgi:hypothetical protein